MELVSKILHSGGCIIKFQSMIRVRCLWLRLDILAERVAGEGGLTRSAFLEICALVSEKPSASRHHRPIP